jgi:hypothetical protein
MSWISLETTSIFRNGGNQNPKNLTVALNNGSILTDLISYIIKSKSY